MELIEQFRELGIANLIVDEPEAVEYSLIQLPAYCSRCDGVVATTVLQELERTVEGVFEVLTLNSRPVKGAVSSLKMAGNTILLTLQLIERDGAGVVSLQELVPLSRQVGDRAGGSRDFPVPFGQHLFQVGHYVVPDGADVLWCQHDGVPVVGDLGLDEVDRGGTELAAVALFLTS